LLGYGTQFAIADLDEGDRIVDAPVVNTKTVEATETSPSADELAEKRSSRKPKTNNSPKESEVAEGWE
jgi:hypothetical protein